MPAQWPGGRWIATAAVVVGLAFFVQRLTTTDDSPLRAFLESGGVVLLVLAVLGALQRFWRGDKITHAAGPGGIGVGFEETKSAVEELNDRVNGQMTTLNDRLYDIEKVVFKDAPPHEAPEE